MKKRLILIIFLAVFISIFLVFFQKDSEKTLLKEDVQTSEKDFQVYLNDDCIYFYDEEGNAVIYNFSGDKVSEAFLLISVSSTEEAEVVKEFYLDSFGSGDIEEIIAEENLVTIVYNDVYLKALQAFTKQEIEAMLESGD